MRRIVYILFLLALYTSSYAQTKRAYLKAAEKAVLENNTYKALTYFNEALEFDTDNPELIYKSAVQAFKFRAYDMAKERFATLVDSLKSTEYADAEYYYGSVLITQGEYEKGKFHLKSFLSKSSDTGLLSNEAKVNKEKARWMIENIDLKDKSARITLMDGVNTPNSEFGAVKIGDKTYFTSMDHKEDVEKGNIPRNISKIHIKDADSTYVAPGSINDGNSSKAYTTYSKDGSRWYYTECNYTNGDSVRCKIYYRILDENGNYNDKILAPSSINMEGFTATTPHIVVDGTGKERLFFASDRPGGNGKLDIYYSVINSTGQFSEPINMSEINTAGDDLSPFYHLESNTLYFGSDGHVGMGGFDIYAYEMGSTDTPEALLAPVNSSYDDLHYYLSPDKKEALFSSNRNTSQLLDNVTKACCFDIYEVEYDDVIIDLDVMTFDSLTRRELMGATVYLIDKKTGDTLDVVTVDDSHHHVFQLKKGMDYTILATREHYEDYRMDLSTKGITESIELKEELYMYCTAMQVDLFTFDNKTKEELIGTDVIVRNLSDPNAEDLVFKNMTGNDYHFYLPLGSRYEVEVSKFGYVTKKEIIDLTTETTPSLIKKDVYLDVFEIEDYKNTAVFFENDYPNPRTRSSETSEIYGNHYNEYISNKSDYIRKVMKNKRIQDKQAAIESVNRFFTTEVEEGYETFQKFNRALLRELEKGRRLEVVLKGYASPVADSKYNATLSERRVNSVKNEMLRYKQGIFRNYLGKGYLKITDISYGDTKAPADVSDNPRDIQESVYSIKAARERRVEIIRVKDQNRK